MGFFKNLFHKRAVPDFTAVKEEQFVLENQVGPVEDPTKDDVTAYLDSMFNDPDQFVTLTLPRAVNGVRFVQACLIGQNPVVQLGLEKGGKTQLVEKTCSTSSECVEIFHLFYDYGIVNNISDYSPVKF